MIALAPGEHECLFCDGSGKASRWTESADLGSDVIPPCRCCSGMGRLYAQPRRSGLGGGMLYIGDTRSP